MNRHLLLAFCAIAFMACACPAEAQKFVNEDYWRLDIKPIPGSKLDKLRVGGTLYYFWVYELKNPEKQAIETDVRIFILTDVLRDGVDPGEVRDWNSFRGFKLPKQPIDEREEFDNTEKWHFQKRFYDRPHSAALAAIKAKLGGKYGELTHTSQIGTLAPGTSKRGIAIFKNVDPRMDYAGIIVKNTVNRIKNIQDEMFMEDKVKVYRFQSPGSSRNVDENPIIPVNPHRWRIIKRERISYPMDK